MKDQDSIFFKNFSLLLGFLVLLTIVLAVVGNLMQNSILGDKNEPPREKIAETIKPVAMVNTGDAIINTVAPVVEEVVVAVSNEPATPEQTYQTVCFACHGTGAAGAPKLVAADWTGRMEKGLDGLTASAINGIGVMPPKGGRADLSDDTIKGVVEFMIKDL